MCRLPFAALDLCGEHFFDVAQTVGEQFLDITQTAIVYKDAEQDAEKRDRKGERYCEQLRVCHFLSLQQLFRVAGAMALMVL